jgi:ribosomal protein S20
MAKYTQQDYEANGNILSELKTVVKKIQNCINKWKQNVW